MNAHNQNLNANATQIPTMAANNMGKSLVQLVLQELKAAPDVWQKMSQAKQNEVIERIRNSVEYNVAGAVNTIITQGHVALAASLKGTANEKEIKATFIVDKANASESLFDLLMSDTGTRCQILLTSAEPYLGGMELISADPDQQALFNEPETPEDSLLWGINIPILTGNSLVPCPNRKDAELYARSIRNKFLEDENEANHDYAKDVYAKPWPESPGAHNRSIAKGNFEAMINWFGKLCRGEIVVEPIALIEFTPEIDATEPDTQKDYSDIADIWVEVVKYVQETKKTGASAIQRKFGLGYNRAASLVDAMEEMGVISYMGASGKRDVLILEGVPVLAIITPVAAEQMGEVVDAEFDPDYVAPADEDFEPIAPLNDDIPEILDSGLDQEVPFTTPESVQFDEVTPEQLVGEIIVTVRVKSDAFVAEYLGHQAKSKFGVDAAVDLLIGKIGLGAANREEITTEQDEDVQVRRFKIVADQE